MLAGAGCDMLLAGVGCDMLLLAGGLCCDMLVWRGLALSSPGRGGALL